MYAVFDSAIRMCGCFVVFMLVLVYFDCVLFDVIVVFVMCCFAMCLCILFCVVLMWL